MFVFNLKEIYLFYSLFEKIEWIIIKKFGCLIIFMKRIMKNIIVLFCFFRGVLFFKEWFLIFVNLKVGFSVKYIVSIKEVWNIMVSK